MVDKKSVSILKHIHTKKEYGIVVKEYGNFKTENDEIDNILATAIKNCPEYIFIHIIIDVGQKLYSKILQKLNRLIQQLLMDIGISNLNSMDQMKK